MASAFGIRVRPRITRDETLAAEIDLDPYRTDGMQEIIDAWLPLTFAVNSLNRAMGNSDLCPIRVIASRHREAGLCSPCRAFAARDSMNRDAGSGKLADVSQQLVGAYAACARTGFRRAALLKQVCCCPMQSGPQPGASDSGRGAPIRDHPSTPASGHR